MSSWETILELFPPEQQFELTDKEKDYIPIYASNAFTADYKDTRCIFALFVDSAIWCKGIGNIWRYTSNNEELLPRKFWFLVNHLDKVEDFDFVLWTAHFYRKEIKWDIASNKWKYLNNWTVHFQSPSTSEAEETKPSIPRGFEKEESNSEESDDKESDSDKESDKAYTPEDDNRAKVNELLWQTKATVTLTIQKLMSCPNTPSPKGTPLRQTSILPGSSKLSILEESSLPTPPMSKAKGQQVPPPQTIAQSLRPSQTTPVPTPTQPIAPQVLKGNPRGTPPQIPPHLSHKGKLKVSQKPSNPLPQPPSPIAAMSRGTTAPKLLGSTPEPYDGNPAKAQAFWNTLTNYYTTNDAIYANDEKKVPAALTNFKTGTQGGDWASDCIATALALNPVNYGTWNQFKTAFKKQFIPPKVQQEAIKGLHDTYMGNWEFNDWYQDWSRHAWRSGVDDNTKIYAFRKCINSVLQQKPIALSPQLATLTDLVDKARDLDRSFHMFIPWSYSSSCGHGHGHFTSWIQELTGEETPTAEINATWGWETTCGHGCRSFKQERLSPEERKHHFKEKLCMYYGKPGHIALNCNLGKHLGLSLCQMDTIPEDKIDKLSIYNHTQVNRLTNNSFLVLDMDVNEMNIDNASF